MNIQESLKTKLDNKIDSLIKTFLEETKSDFDIIWNDFIKEAKDKKEELKREGFALQERNKILKEEELMFIENVSEMNGVKQGLIKEIEDYDKRLEEIETGKQENINKTKQLDEREEKQTAESLEIKTDREKMKTEMTLLESKEISIKRAFSHLNK